MIFVKRFILDAWEGSEYTSAIYQSKVLAREIFIIENVFS